MLLSANSTDCSSPVKDDIHVAFKRLEESVDDLQNLLDYLETRLIPVTAQTICSDGEDSLKDNSSGNSAIKNKLNVITATISKLNYQVDSLVCRLEI